MNQSWLTVVFLAYAVTTLSTTVLLFCAFRHKRTNLQKMRYSLRLSHCACWNGVISVVYLAALPVSAPIAKYILVGQVLFCGLAALVHFLNARYYHNMNDVFEKYGIREVWV